MGERILVINDTQEILELFRDILGDEGYEVILYSYAIQDLNEIERIQPDLIILDYIFGEERTGWQMLQKLKMRRSTASIPVVVCTAAVREARETEGFLTSKGVTLVLKPFDIDDLLQMVRKSLESRQTPAQATRAVEAEQHDAHMSKGNHQEDT
jgi:DNA-binding response OmpR family regulator